VLGIVLNLFFYIENEVITGFTTSKSFTFLFQIYQDLIFRKQSNF